MPMVRATAKPTTNKLDIRLLAGLVGMLGLVQANAFPGETKTASIGLDGSHIMGSDPAISADGRYVAFHASAGGGYANVYVRDLLTDQTEVISINSSGVEGNHDSYRPTISADGRFVAFVSRASNLVSNDTNSRDDIFVRDRATKTTMRVSVDSWGTQANADSYVAAISGNGRFVAFWSIAYNLVPNDTNLNSDIFLHNLVTKATTRIPAYVDLYDPRFDNSKYKVCISAEGDRIAFWSNARDLVPGDTNGLPDVFCYDRGTNVMNLVSKSAAGIIGEMESDNPSISSDGRYVTFDSWSRNLVEGDRNQAYDVFRKDLVSEATNRVSTGAGSLEGNGDSYASAISGDARFTVFVSRATNIAPGSGVGAANVCVKDLFLDTANWIGTMVPSNAPNAVLPAISRDGQFVAFNAGLVSGSIVRTELSVAAGLVRIYLAYEGWKGCLAPSTAVYELRNGAGLVLSSGTVHVAWDGAVVLPTPPPGPITLTIKAPGFLRKRVVFTQASTTVNVGPLTLRNGDCDDDNEVSILDYLLLSNSYETTPTVPGWDPRADLDGDSEVSIIDYLLLSNNFELAGD